MRGLRIALALIAASASGLLHAAAPPIPPGPSATRAIALRQNDARLLRAASAASVSNPVTNLPWRVPATYAASTAYAIGEVVSNGGNWYMAGLAGTSPSSGTGPTTTTSGSYVQDGSSGLYWSYLGGAQITSSDALAPVVTFSTTNPALGVNYAPVTYPDRYRTLGGYSAAYRTVLWQGLTFNAAPLSGAASAQTRGMGWSFRSDAPVLGISLPSNSGCTRVLVDGRLLQPGCFYTAGTDSWLKIDWSSVGGRRPRTYEVECGKSSCYFGGAQVSASDQLWPAPFSDDVRVAWVQDSYDAGSSYGPWLAGAGLSTQVGKLLGWRDMWRFSTGGTGYIATNSGLGNTYGDRVAEACTRAPNVWVVMGSTNDVGSTSATITAAASSMYAAIRACSTAPIIVIGPAFPNATTDSARIEAAVQAAVTARQQAGDTRIFFVPVSTDTVPWVTGSWNATASFSSNVSVYIGGDGVHPVELGTAYLARRIEAAIRAQVLPVLARQAQ